MTVASYDTRETGSQPDPERRLAELARSGGPLRRTLAAVAGRMVARRGWERLGYARLGDYARERLGLSARSLEEWARVDQRLGPLPELEAALVSGALPWSKVRLLARFVTPEDEAVWIAHAMQRSVRVLEGEVRAVDRGALETGGLVLDEEGAECETTERVRIPASPALCFGWQRVRTYAEKVSGETLVPGAVLELVTAETLSALPLDGAALEQLESERGEESAPGNVAHGLESSEASAAESVELLAPGAESGRAEDPPGAARETPEGTPMAARLLDTASGVASSRAPDVAPGSASAVASEAVALPPFLRSLKDGLEAANAFELDARLRRAVRLEQRLDAAIGPLLRQVSSGEYAWREAYQTLGAYAREHLGISPRKARALLRLERAGDHCPALRRAYRDGGLSWVQAQVLVPLLARSDTRDGPWREAWVDVAPRVSVRQLKERVDRALTLREADPDAWARVQDRPEQLAQIPEPGSGRLARPLRQVCANPRVFEGDLSLKITAPAEVARLFRAVLCTLRRAIERDTGRLPEPGEAFEAMLTHALRAWGVDEPWLLRWAKRVSPVFERDGSRCTVPGCSSRRNLHAHHIVFRSAGGSDAPENLTTLCAFHHQRGVHGGLVAVRGRAPDRLTFEIGLRPGLPPLARYRSGDLVA